MEKLAGGTFKTQPIHSLHSMHFNAHAQRDRRSRSLLDAAGSTVSVDVHPLQLYILPDCLGRLASLFSATNGPESLSCLQRAAAQGLSSEGRLRVQIEQRPTHVVPNIEINVSLLLWRDLH